MFRYVPHVTSLAEFKILRRIGGQQAISNLQQIIFDSVDSVCSNKLILSGCWYQFFISLQKEMDLSRAASECLHHQTQKVRPPHVRPPHGLHCAKYCKLPVGIFFSISGLARVVNECFDGWRTMSMTIPPVRPLPLVAAWSSRKIIRLPQLLLLRFPKRCSDPQASALMTLVSNLSGAYVFS